MASNAIKVFIKIRPLIHREKSENAQSMWNVSGNVMKSTEKDYEMTFGELNHCLHSLGLLNHVIRRKCVEKKFSGTNSSTQEENKTQTIVADCSFVLMIGALSCASDDIEMLLKVSL